MQRFYLVNKIIDPYIQKCFLSGVNGTMEHIFTLTSIIDHARKNDLPLTITFIDFKNAFGSISHSFVKDIMFHMKVPDNIIKYITNLYNSLIGFVHSSSWVTSVFPITHGVFQGDTMSPIIIFLMALTPVIKMMGKINCPGFYSNIPIPKAKTFHMWSNHSSAMGRRSFRGT